MGMKAIWSVVFLGLSAAVAQAQQPTLPDLDFDRRGDRTYMDSMLAVGHAYLRRVELLPRNRHNDTLRLEGLRYLTVVFKQTRGPQRDSSYYYAQRLHDRAVQYNNTLFAVRGLMQQEYYRRVVKTDYLGALTINRQVAVLSASLPRESSPRWQVQLNMGEIYVLLKDYEAAVKSYAYAKELLGYNTSLTPKNRRLLLAQVETQIGEVFDVQKNTGEALRHFEESLRIVTGTRSQLNVAYANERIGDFFTTQRQPTRAIPYYEEATLVWTRLDDQTGQASAWARLAECYALTNRPALAIELGEKSLAISQRRGLERIRQMANQALYRAYRQTNQPARALARYEDYITLRDSLNDLRRVNEIADLQKKYEIEQVQIEAGQQRLLQQQQLTNQQRLTEVERLRTEAVRQQYAGEARTALLERSLENGRLRAATERGQLQQQARIAGLNRDIARQYLTRTLLVGGVLLLMAFVLLLYRQNRLAARQQLEIERLNTGLEGKVRARTTELETANAQLRAKNQEIEEALLRGQTQERRRVAADLHDNLGGTLIAIKNSLLTLNPARLTSREQGIYHNLHGMIRGAYTEVRHLSHNLQPEELEKHGLAEAVQRLVTRLNLTQPIRFDLCLTELPHLSKSTEFHLYSICLELCTNVLRHSQATLASVVFETAGSDLVLTVDDNGQGMTDSEASGMGLQNIYARTETLGGWISVQTAPQVGTSFCVVLPVRVGQTNGQVVG
jgi:signal transduction histidine kinase